MSNSSKDPDLIFPREQPFVAAKDADKNRLHAKPSTVSTNHSCQLNMLVQCSTVPHLISDFQRAFVDDVGHGSAELLRFYRLICRLQQHRNCQR